MSVQLSIYGYTNFRQFLADFYQHKKSGKRGYSFRQFSQMAGFKSPNILKLVIEGQRNLTPQSVEKFLEALNLTGNQAAYFRSLVLMNQAESDEERREHYSNLQRLMPHAKRHQLDAEAAEYLSHWIYPVLRELVQHPDFRDDPYWIQRRLTGRIDVKEIVKALNFLKKNDLIAKDASGRFTVKDDMVISSDEVKSLAVRTYHRCALEQSLAALSDLPLDQREFGALIFQLPEQSLLELKQRLKLFRQELHEWALEQQKKNSENTVIQLNLQMFPQTKKALS
jgi:uncharacterized protein (TIGR02147 family)